MVVSLVVAGQAFGQWPTYSVPQPFDWEESTPEEHGLDSAILNKALRKGRKLPYLRALVVVKDGHLIAERYYRGTRPADANTVMSVSKSFISALTGIAISQRYLSLSSRMLDFFPESIAADIDPRMHDITIRHLLTMTAGLPYDDHDDHWSRWMPSPDGVRSGTTRPAAHTCYRPSSHVPPASAPCNLRRRICSSLWVSASAVGDRIRKAISGVDGTCTSHLGIWPDSVTCT